MVQRYRVYGAEECGSSCPNSGVKNCRLKAVITRDVCLVPDDEGEVCLASEVCKPEIREGDLIEAKNPQGTVIRGRVVTSGLSGIPDDDGEVCVSFQGLRGARHDYQSIRVYLDASKVTVLERADGSKP